MGSVLHKIHFTASKSIHGSECMVGGMVHTSQQYSHLRAHSYPLTDEHHTVVVVEILLTELILRAGSIQLSPCLVVLCSILGHITRWSSLYFSAILSSLMPMPHNIYIKVWIHDSIPQNKYTTSSILLGGLSLSQHVLCLHDDQNTFFEIIVFLLISLPY